VAPPEVRNFILKFIFYENKSHKDSDNCAEGLDYRLEEMNKKFKEYLHVLFPTFNELDHRLQQHKCSGGHE
jgi:hypothetical protein